MTLAPSARMPSVGIANGFRPAPRGKVVQPRRLASLALWIFAAGMVGWTIANATLGGWVNVVTDIVIVVGAALVALGLPRALDGLGPGRLRTGLVLVAVAQFAQNLVTVTTGLSGTNAAPAFVVMAGSVAMLVGAKRWEADGWDAAALPWVTLGFAAFAFEPLYYLALQVIQAVPIGPFFPGAVLVGAGAALAAWAFRPSPAKVTDEPVVASTPARRSRA